MPCQFRRILPLVVTLLPVLATSVANAEDLPKRKSGLWEVRMAVPGMPAGMGPMQTCVDEKSDDLMKQQSQTQVQKNCSQTQVKRDGDRVVVHSVCQFDKVTATTDATFSGHFDSAYRGDIKTLFNPPMAGRGETQMTVEAKWLGPCKAGQKPGDVIFNGRTMNRASMGQAGASR